MHLINCFPPSGGAMAPSGLLLRSATAQMYLQNQPHTSIRIAKTLISNLRTIYWKNWAWIAGRWSGSQGEWQVHIFHEYFKFYYWDKENIDWTKTKLFDLLSNFMSFFYDAIFILKLIENELFEVNVFWKKKSWIGLKI